MALIPTQSNEVTVERSILSETKKKCINTRCESGENLSKVFKAVDIVCSYYQVPFDEGKKQEVCENCLHRWLEYYKEFKSDECMSNDHFLDYIRQYMMEADENNSVKPDIDSKIALSLNSACDYFIDKNNDLLNSQVQLFNEQIDNDEKKKLDAADKLDQSINKLEEDINLFMDMVKKKKCM